MDASPAVTAAVSSAKKLVQARLPFQIYKTKDAEPPRKKIALSTPEEDQAENVQDINAIPIVYITDSENSPIKLGTCGEEESKLELTNDVRESAKKKKRDSFDDKNDKNTVKKLKLDTRSKLSKFKNATKAGVEHTTVVDLEDDTNSRKTTVKVKEPSSEANNEEEQKATNEPSYNRNDKNMAKQLKLDTKSKLSKFRNATKADVEHPLVVDLEDDIGDDSDSSITVKVKELSSEANNEEEPSATNEPSYDKSDQNTDSKFKLDAKSKLSECKNATKAGDEHPSVTDLEAGIGNETSSTKLGIKVKEPSSQVNNEDEPTTNKASDVAKAKKVVADTAASEKIDLDNTVQPVSTDSTEEAVELKNEVAGDRKADDICEKESENSETTNIEKEPQTPSGKVPPPRKKTPKQLEKQLEATKRREEKERLKQEKETKKQQDKEEKLKLKEEKEQQRKKELEEKDELKRKAREDKERKKQQEIELKNEEKRRKEEDKKRKEEEEASQKNKFAKEAVVFTNFFTKVDLEKTRKSEGPIEAVEQAIIFKPFEVKNRMRLAPINRNPLDDGRRSVLDEKLLNQDVWETYITQLRCGEIKPGRGTKTWPLEEVYQEEDSEVEELPSEDATEPVKCSAWARVPGAPRAKLLQFSENRRPPYWGTWRAKCSEIGPRRPFGTYKKFEYDVDSDEEWEEEEPGESLHGSDDEKEKEDQDDEDDYEVDNDIFVPHGYLSEDEAQPDEPWDVEQQKEKLKLLGEQFDNERSEKTKKLRPIVVGCIWDGDNNSDLAYGGNNKVAALLLRCLPWLAGKEPPITLGGSEEPDSPDGRDGKEGRDLKGISPGGSIRRGVFPEHATSALLIRVHGATVRLKAIAKDFALSWAKDNPNSPLLSVAAVTRKVRELAQWQECPEPPMLGRHCWFVPRSVRDQHGCGDLVLPTRETVRTGARVVTDDADIVASPSTSKITKFTRVLTEEERRQALKTPRPILTDGGDSINFRKVAGSEEPSTLISPSITPSFAVEKALEKLNRFRLSDTPRPKKVPILFSSPCGVPIVKPTSYNGTGSPACDDAKVIPKKKVAILFSSPCGVPINKLSAGSAHDKANTNITEVTPSALTSNLNAVKDLQTEPKAPQKEVTITDCLKNEPKTEDEGTEVMEVESVQLTVSNGEQKELGRLIEKVDNPVSTEVDEAVAIDNSERPLDVVIGANETNVLVS